MPWSRIVLDCKILIRPPRIVERLILAPTRVTLGHLNRYPALNFLVNIARGSIRHVSGSTIQRLDGDVELGQRNFPNSVAFKGSVGMRAAVDAGAGGVLRR